MVRHAGLLLALCGLLMAADAADFLVQERGGLPKSASELKIGQQFRSESDGEIDADGLKVFIYKGTVGFRLGVRDFYIAQGRISVGPMPLSDPKLLLKPHPLTLRFLRGAVRSMGSDDLALHSDGEIRWYKRKVNEHSSIVIDRKNVGLASGQMLVATRTQVHILEENQTAFGTLVLKEDMPLAELLVLSTIVSESKSAASTRNESVEFFLNHDTPARERRHAMDQARRAFPF